MTRTSHKVVIVGGGAGGLELAVRLGRKFGPTHVYLIDQAVDHIWKPSLHEVAAGTLDIHREGLSYAMLARNNGFTFVLGRVSRVDPQAKIVRLDNVVFEGHDIFPPRDLLYDTLVLAVGSKSNFFGTPGANEFAIALDSTGQAERFRQLLLRDLVIADRSKGAGDPAAGTPAASGPSYPLRIAIVGGGATGVELAAELREAARNVTAYGLDHLDPGHDVKIALLEGAPRILSGLPESMSRAATSLLLERGINVNTSVRITEVTADALYDDKGTRYPYDLCVWAAGIQAPEFLAGMGLPVNRINQVEVNAGLRTADPAVFAFGDCAEAPWGGKSMSLPARAQVAHQQAGFLIPTLTERITGRDVQPRAFKYRDYGSLVSVGHNTGVGTLMGVLSGRRWFVEGLIARWMYMSLHLRHHMAVLGVVQTALMAVGRLLLKRSAPRVKLH